MRRIALPCALLSLFILTNASSAALAQETWNFGLVGGTALERSSGPGGIALRESPRFLDFTAQRYAKEPDGPIWAASLRAEATGKGGIGIVPRAGLRKALGALELRPFIGLTMMLTPKTLYGPELSLEMHLGLGETLALKAIGFFTAYLYGSNLPESTTLLQTGGCFGLSVIL